MDFTEQTPPAKPQMDGQWAEPKPQPDKHLLTSLEAEVAKWSDMLRPPSLTTIMAELSRCLTLVAPTGMTHEDRLEWLKIAAPELDRMPSGYFADACQHARRTADHPAKILPAILKYEPKFLTEGKMRRYHNEAVGRLENLTAPRLTQQNRIDPDEREAVGKSMGDLVKELEAAARAQSL